MPETGDKLPVEILNCFNQLMGEMAGVGGANRPLLELMEKVPPSVRREVGDELLKQLTLVETIAFAPEDIVGNYREKTVMIEKIREIEALLLHSVKLGLGDASERKEL